MCPFLPATWWEVVLNFGCPGRGAAGRTGVGAAGGGGGAVRSFLGRKRKNWRRDAASAAGAARSGARGGAGGNSPSPWGSSGLHSAVISSAQVRLPVRELKIVLTTPVPQTFWTIIPSSLAHLARVPFSHTLGVLSEEEHACLWPLSGRPFPAGVLSQQTPLAFTGPPGLQCGGSELAAPGDLCTV